MKSQGPFLLKTDTGKNLSSGVPADEVHVGVTHDTGGALGDVSDEALFCRMTATCIRGVSDPLFSSAEPRQEGGRGGRSRPACLLHCY